MGKERLGVGKRNDNKNMMKKKKNMKKNKRDKKGNKRRTKGSNCLFKYCFSLSEVSHDTSTHLKSGC
jgi:hypothetical protein